MYMSSQLIGTLFGAIVLQNTDAFTFYCIMTGICVLASLFFLLLRPVQEKKTGDDHATVPDEPKDCEPKSSTKEQIMATFRMLGDRRIRALYPLVLSTALNNSIISAVFIKLIVNTMEENRT